MRKPFSQFAHAVETVLASLGSCHNQVIMRERKCIKPQNRRITFWQKYDNCIFWVKRKEERAYCKPRKHFENIFGS